MWNRIKIWLWKRRMRKIARKLMKAFEIPDQRLGEESSIRSATKIQDEMFKNWLNKRH